METTSATIETISCSLKICISFLDLYHLQNGIFCLYDIDIVGTTKMNTGRLIVRQNFARDSQCFHKKPNQSTRIL